MNELANLQDLVRQSMKINRKENIFGIARGKRERSSIGCSNRGGRWKSDVSHEVVVHAGIRGAPKIISADDGELFDANHSEVLIALERFAGEAR